MRVSALPGIVYNISGLVRALEDIRLNMAELTKENVDLNILANMQQNRINSSQTKQPRIRTERSDIVQLLSSFFLADRCADQLTFLLMEWV